MSFLPEGYRTPEGNYAKFKQGENTFRVLGSAIIGYEYWNTANKPVRSEKPFTTIPSDIRQEEDGKISIKHFWMFPIWSYDNQKVQIMEVTQKGIQEAVKALATNKKWGDPTGYDITITKEGTRFDTTYQVMPNPHSELDPVAMATWIGTRLDLQAIYSGGDPFMPQAELTDEERQQKERAEIAEQAVKSAANNIASA